MNSRSGSRQSRDRAQKKRVTMFPESLRKAIKSLYGRDGGVCRPDTKTPACEAGVQEDCEMQSTVLEMLARPKGDSDITTHGKVCALVEVHGGGLVSVSPELAREIVSHTNFTGQRRIQLARKVEHISNIREGRWIPLRSEITFAQTPDRRLYLINGQHRLTAIAESGRVTKTRLQIIPAADMADVRRLYATFDAPGESRSDNEMLSGAGIADGMGLKPKTVNSVYKALSIIRNGMEPAGNRVDTTGARSRSGRLTDLAEWEEEARAYEAIVETADTWLQRKMVQQGCMASALYLLRYQPMKAREFFSGIAANDGLKKHDPRARLIADFQQRRLNSGGIRQSVQQVAVAWNAFYDGRNLTLIKCISGGPIIFRGTPKGARR